MRNKLNKRFINKTGYTKGTSTEKNSMNIIPGEDITMQNTDYPLIGIPVDNMGNPLSDPTMMLPGNEYYYPGADYVIETPLYQKGGVAMQKKIYKIQPGVINSKGSDGYRIYYKDPSKGGITPEDFEWISPSGYKTLLDMPNFQAYKRAQETNRSVEDNSVAMFKKGGKKEAYISYKIKKLIDEGYPQKQAVAIAYSMADEKFQMGGMYNQNFSPFNYSPVNPFINTENTPDTNNYLPGQLPSFEETFRNYSYKPEITSSNQNVNLNRYSPGQLPSFEEVFSNTNYDMGVNFPVQPINPQTYSDISISPEQIVQDTSLPNFPKPDSSTVDLNIYDTSGKVIPRYTQNIQDTVAEDKTIIDNSILNKNLSKEAEKPKASYNDFQFFNPYAGIDIPTAAYTLGRSIQEDNATGIGFSGLKLATGLGRNLLSGMGSAKRKEDVMEGYRRLQRDYVTGADRPQVFQEGGKLEKALTGEYLFGMDEANPMLPPNAEIEKNEYVQHPNSEIQKAVGETHENGGIEVALEDGTRILSDHLKLGSKNAKYFKDNFGLELKAGDTFSKVLDKFNSKSGLKKIIDEQEDLIEEIQKQQEKTKDETAFGLNIQYISGKLKELEDKKKPLEEQRKIIFEEAYVAQEKSKPEEERDEDIYQDGGEFYSLAKKYGFSPDQAHEILKKYQQGGSVDTSRYYSPLSFNNPELFTQQRFTQDNILAGNVTQEEALNRLRQQYNTLPNLIRRSGLGTISDTTGNYPLLLRDPNMVDAEGNPIPVSVNASAENIGNFQRGYNEYITKTLEAINANPNMTAAQKQALVSQLQQERFGEGTARKIDSILGNYTSSRSGVALPALTDRDRELYGNTIQRIGDVVNPDGSIRQGFENLSDDAKNYIQQVVIQGGESTYDIGLLDIPVTTPEEKINTDMSSETTSTQTDKTKSDAYTMGIYLLPEQNPLPPTGLQPHLKINRRFERITPALLSPEQNLEEIRRQEAAATEQINMLPDSQRRAAIANLNANTQQNINKAVSETARLNSQIQTQADLQNAQTQRMEENAAANDALSYEQRQLTALAKTQADINNYYNTLQERNAMNFNKINQLNLINAMQDDYQYTPYGIVKTTPESQFTFNQKPQNTSAIKKRVSRATNNRKR